MRCHEQSHPYLDGYRPDFSGDTNWDAWKSKMLDNEVLKLDDVMNRCAAAEAPHGGFAGLAGEIARRIYKEVARCELR